MRPILVEQEGIRITQECPDFAIIEMNGKSITLTQANTELLRVMLYEAYRTKRWTYSKKERSAKNKALWAIARAQGKKKPDKKTEEIYEQMGKRMEKAMSNYPDVTKMELPDIGNLELPGYDFSQLPKNDYL